MGKTVFVTEKPSVAAEYRKVLQVQDDNKSKGYYEGHSAKLGADVIITWAVGHLIALCKPELQNPDWKEWKRETLPMIPKRFKYAVVPTVKKQYDVIASVYTRNDVDCIYYAGDSGREGIYIQALIRNQIFKTAPALTEKVVWIDSYTEDSILNGIKTAKPYSDYQPMIDSGYMRAISDWLIGMNFSRCFSMTSGSMRVGRVMTPTLAMVVKRQAEIDNFVKTDFYGVKADDFAAWRAVKGSRFYESSELYNENGFIDRTAAQALADECGKDLRLTVEDVKVQTKTEYAPYLFNLADLQATCSKRLHISPARTLEIVQSLYEKKFTTYPRTDSRFLTTAVAKDLKAQGYDIPKRYVDDSKVTDHYAIIPTFQGNQAALSDETNEKSVYEVILKRFTDTMLPPYIYEAVSVTYLHSNKERFFEAYRINKQLGFKEKDEPAADDKADEVETVSNKPVPQKGAVISVSAFTIKEMETKPPTAYTTGSLILAMEKAGKLVEDEELREQIKTSGIGTSATRAGILEKLQKDGYITVDKRQKIAPTDVGKQIIPIIAKYDEALVSPLKTADMENRLSAIANREIKKDQYLDFVTQYVQETTKRVLAENHERVVGANGAKQYKQYDCPCCGKPMKYGKFGWWCSGKPDCTFSLNIEICGHKMKEKDLADLIEKGRTAAYVFKSPKSGNEFKAVLVLDKSARKSVFEFVNDKDKKK